MGWLVTLALLMAAPARSVTWVRGSGGASCDVACAARDGCNEDAWPTTETQFYEISKLAGGWGGL